MKKKKITKLSGLIASALLIVIICSAPMTATAQTARYQSSRKTVGQTEIPSPGAKVSARASAYSAYSRARTGTVTVSVPTASRRMAETQTVRYQSAQKPAAQTEIPGIAAPARTSDRSAYSMARTGALTVTLPTGRTVTVSVPTVSREKAAAISTPSPVTANPSTGRVTSGTKAGGQPTKSNSSSLCLVVLGLQLNPDGSMQQELIGRLEALKIAAQNNPQAIIVCTGGHTAENNRAVSEAGQMAKWLRENGIDSGRIMVESNATSTQANAAYTLKLLKQYHPEVSRIAIVTSAYQMNDGVQIFTALAAQTGSGITVTAGRASSTK